MRKSIKTHLVSERFELFNDDCLAVLSSMKTDSVNSVVTDPPYGLKFMNRKWDYQIPSQEIWEECLRVLKPGGHLLSFGGSRTSHRIVCSIEDAGFEIRDSVMWLFGQGFPKSLNVGKAIDKEAGVERKVTGSRKADVGIQGGNFSSKYCSGVIELRDIPVTDAAKKWEGWGTALKPAFENICVARKPLGERTVALNVLKHATGAINIDGCRITTQDDLGGGTFDGVFSGTRDGAGNLCKAIGSGDKGRWPANIILSHSKQCKQIGTKAVKGRSINRFIDGAKPFGNGAGHEYESEEFPDDEVSVFDCVEDCPIRIMDEQSDKSKSAVRKGGKGGSGLYKGAFGDGAVGGFVDSGGVSRFFYCAKTSKSERSHNGKIENNHPTVKPIALMRYLCRLVTPPDGLVLDPFCGSGSTGVACAPEGFRFCGIEYELDSYKVATLRISDAYKKE